MSSMAFRLTLQVGDPKHPNSGVYCIRCILNGKSYIGSSVNLGKRMKEHRRVLRKGKHHSRVLQRAWDKYGEQMFEFFVMEYAAPDVIRDSEQWWLDNASCAYNSSRAATHVTLTPEQRAAISEKAKVTWSDPERRKAARDRRLKQIIPPPSPESIAKVAARNKAIQREKHRTIFAFGKLWCMKELAEEYGVHYGMLRDRLATGWEPETAVLKPKRRGSL